MKYIIFTTALLMGFGFFSLTFGQADDLSVEKILTEIKNEQGVAEISAIECPKVSDSNFEKLGEAVMNVMHPDQRQHELMDQMMGGEGSESLKAMHILMGKNYLGCGYNQYGYGSGMGGMMGGGMMENWAMRTLFSSSLSPRQFGAQYMMGNFGIGGWFGWIFMLLFWILIILAIAVIIKWLANQARGGAGEKSALDILKERYAKGEISKEEFEAKKKDLL